MESEEPTDSVKTMDQGEGTVESPNLGNEEGEGDDEGDFTTVQSRKRLRSKEVASGEKPKAQTGESMPQVAKENKYQLHMLELD